MVLRLADKVEFTDTKKARYEMDDVVHFIRRVYTGDDAFNGDVEYAVGCKCDVFVEGDDLVKVDNECELTCPECIERLEQS